MFKNTLIIAGLLSVMSLSAQAVDTRTIIDKDTTINGISGVTTTNNGNGGAVQNNGYNLTINGNFTNNTLENGTGQAVFGGAVYQAGGKLTINDGIVFDGNTVKSKSQTYPTWDGVDSASGGAIFITGANAQLKGNGTVTFRNNQAQAIGANDQSNGGALHIESIDSADFENVVFNSNSSKNRGGAVYVGDTAFTINGKGEFSDNSAMTGGAIYSLDTTGKTVIVTGSNSTFTNNTATGNGGSIANFDGTINVGQNNSFSGNNTAGKGGAIYNSNWQKTSTTNIEGGTSFTGNSAGDKGGAVYNSGNVNLDTTAGNITFSGNTAKSGADVYLDGTDSKLVINGTNANNKVSFGSNGSIAGNGSITHQSAGTVEFKDNKNVDGFTGTYTQTSGKTSLNNSNMFNKYNISAGEFELLNGSNATIDNTNKIFNGSVLTIGGTSDNQSVLNIGTASDAVSIAQNVAINLQQGGKININNGSVILNNAVTRDTLGGADIWQGDINTSAGGSLILDSFSHDTTTGSYTQNGGSLVLQGNSNLAMSDSASSITGGTVDIQTGNTLSVSNGSSIGGNTTTNAAGELNIGNNGSITGGTTNVSGTMNVNKDGTVSGGTTNVDGTLNVANGGAITGGTTNVNDGGQLNVSGNINGSANTIIASGGTVNVNGGTIDTTGKTNIQNGSTLNITNNGSVTLKEGDNWSGSIVNTGSNLTLNGIIHDTVNGSYSQNGGNLTLQNGSDLTLNAGSAITDGTVNIEDSIFNIASGGNITGGEILVGDASTFNMADGAIMSGGKIEFTGETGTLGINGTVERDAVFDVLSNTVSIGQTGNVTLNKDTVTGDNWTDGTIALDGGTLNFEGTNNGTNGKFIGRKGNLNVSSGSQNFVVGQDSIIKNDVITTVDKGSTIEVTGGQASFGSDDKINGSLSISDGTLNLNNVTKGETFSQTGGTTNITGNFALDNASDSVSAGTFNIGNNNTAATVNQSNGVIAEAANVNIANNSTLNITGGTTTLNGGETNADNWLGAVQLGVTGVLNLKDINTHGALTTDGGTLNLANSNLTLLENSSIGKDTAVSFDNTNTININGGSAAFDGTEWGGSVTLDKGTLNYAGTSNGTLIANGGNLNTEEGSNLSINAGSYIEDAVTAAIAGNLTINGTDAENGGRVNLGDGDSVTGNISINNFGTLNMGDNVTMAEEGQTITFNGANAVMNLNGNNNLDLKAEITGSAGEINKNGSGNVIFSGTTGNYNGNLTINNSGDLTFVDENGFGGNLIFGDIDGKNIGIIADTIIGSTTLDRDANITYSTYRDVDLRFGNSVSVSKGSITAQARPGQNVIFDNQAIAQENGKLNASGQNVTFTNGAEISGNALLSATAVDKAVMNDITATDSTIRTSAGATEFNTLNLTNSNAFIMQNGFSSQAINIDGISGINVMNGTVTNNDMGAVNLTDGSTGNYSIDIAPRWWTNDKFLAGSVTTDGTATLNIDNFQFVGKAPIDRYIGIKIFESVNPMENILFTATDKEVFTPIGYYRLFSQGNGNYTAALTRYNDQVFRGQVATVANWQNQLVVNNVLFDHTQQINMQYLAQQNPNLYAAASPLFAPYQYNRKDGSLWFKSFGTFEKLSMTRDLNVDNNFYGALIGADFPAIDLKKGWTLLPTAYIGYTGAHQRYSGTSMYQNGGQGGAMATVMKDDFIGSLLVYGGGYGNTMDVRGFSDETANWFVGTAAKAAYNFHPTKRFIVQPNLLASYTMFGEQKWYTGYGDMTMYSKMLNGVNVAPGLNLIYGRETWSIYATVQYFYNILGHDSGYAGHVSLPDIGMRHGYLEYGFGFTKTWKDRFSAYAQFVIRNAGRTGVGVQGGLMYKL